MPLTYHAEVRRSGLGWTWRVVGTPTPRADGKASAIGTVTAPEFSLGLPVSRRSAERKAQRAMEEMRRGSRESWLPVPAT